MDKERSVDYWANEGGKRIEFVALANGDVRINFNTSDGRTYESLTLASYRYASVVEAIGKFHKGNTMNNKELTELKREKREVTKLFKKWFVRRPNGNCQVLFALTELDDFVDEIDKVYQRKETQ